MMTSKITLTVALAAGLLLISVCDAGANPVAEKSADIREPDFGGVPEPEPMTEEDMLKLLMDCAASRLSGVQLTQHQVFQIKMAVHRVSKNEVNQFVAQGMEQPEEVVQQALGFLLEQCLMEDMDVNMSNPPMM